MKGKEPLRPPGIKSKKEFYARCVSCGQCQAVCIFGCIEMESSSFFDLERPLIKPEKAPCFLCMRCSSICPTNALKDIKPEEASMGKAIMDKSKCLNYLENQGTMCWTCYEKCPLKGRAINLEFGYLPEIKEHCVGCGVCAYVCPVKAIKVLPTQD